MSIKIIEPDNQTKDYQRFYIDRPDSTFSPERNKHIVEKTMKIQARRRRDKYDAYTEGIRERARVIEKYLKYVDRGGSKPIEKWVGKRELARLQGRRIKHTLLNARNKHIKLEEIN